MRTKTMMIKITVFTVILVSIGIVVSIVPQVVRKQQIDREQKDLEMLTSMKNIITEAIVNDDDLSEKITEFIGGREERMIWLGGCNNIAYSNILNTQPDLYYKIENQIKQYTKVSSVSASTNTYGIRMIITKQLDVTVQIEYENGEVCKCKYLDDVYLR